MHCIEGAGRTGGNMKKKFPSPDGDKVPIEVEFTDGYEERFTIALLKIYTNRLKKAEQFPSPDGEISAS